MVKPSMRIRFVLAFAAAALLVPGRAPRVLAADQPMPPYDPALCHEDAKGKRYIARGVAVYAIEPDPTIFRGSLLLRPDYRLTPPDPDDEVGCPSNPQQFSYFLTPLTAIFPQVRQALAESNLGDYAFLLTWLHESGLEALDGKPLIPAKPDPFRDFSGFTDGLCNKPDAAITEEQGAKICRWPPTRDEPATGFVVSPQRYATPAGDPFRVYCGVDAYYNGRFPHIWSQCTVGSYAMPSGLGVYFAFHPLMSVRSPDFLDRVIKFDRRLREVITSATIANYPWRETTGSNALTKDHSP